jgi:TolB-like protein
VLLALIGAGGAWYFVRANGPATVATNARAGRLEAAHLSIVVLPFTNLSGDPNQDYFADGITDNLTTDISRIRNSFVIARNTAFTFKDKNIPIKDVSKELGVRYVLEGSVQRDQNRVRVNVQLPIRTADYTPAIGPRVIWITLRAPFDGVHGGGKQRAEGM